MRVTVSICFVTNTDQITNDCSLQHPCFENSDIYFGGITLPNFNLQAFESVRVSFKLFWKKNENQNRPEFNESFLILESSKFFFFSDCGDHMFTVQGEDCFIRPQLVFFLYQSEQELQG